MTGRWSQGRGREVEDVFTESEVQEVRKTNVSGRDGQREREMGAGLGWGGIKKGCRVTEKRGGRLKGKGPGQVEERQPKRKIAYGSRVSVQERGLRKALVGME